MQKSFIYLINTDASILNGDEEDKDMLENTGWQASHVYSDVIHNLDKVMSECFEMMNNAFPETGFRVCVQHRRIEYWSNHTLYMIIILL